jgi:toxin-antitoxin system PIN domain toxin
MLLTDVNVLLEAFHPSAARHRTAYLYLDMLMSGRDPFGWNSTLLSSVYRISTGGVAFPLRATPEEALAYCRAIAGSVRSRRVEPGQDFWQVFEAVLLGNKIAGKKTSDAFFAALAIEHDCTWVTWDRDFLQFKELEVLSPEEAIAKLGS